MGIDEFAEGDFVDVIRLHKIIKAPPAEEVVFEFLKDHYHVQLDLVIFIEQVHKQKLNSFILIKDGHVTPVSA